MIVQFGIRNVHIAKILSTSGTTTYDIIKSFPGAVSLTLDLSGGVTPYYADDRVYYQATSNQGYTGTLEVARIHDWFAEEIMNNIMDSDNVLVENADIQPSSFALLCETQTDTDPIKYVFYNVLAERASIGLTTKTDTAEPTNSTINITCSPDINTGDVFARTGESTSTETLNGWYNSVHVRDGEAVESSAVAAPTSFSKGSPQDVTITVTPGAGAAITGLRNGSASVNLNNYTVSGNEITLKQAYLSTQTNGEKTFTVLMSTGNNPTVTVTIAD